MLGWLRNKAFSLKQLQGSIDYIESFEQIERWELIDSLTTTIAGALLSSEKKEMTQKEIIEYLQEAKNDVIKKNKLTDERNIEFSMFYIPLVFFRALAIPDASDGKQALIKVLQLLVKGKDSAAKSYVFNWCGLKV